MRSRLEVELVLKDLLKQYMESGKSEWSDVGYEEIRLGDIVAVNIPDESHEADIMIKTLQWVLDKSNKN